jgi:glycosyltransferase involved in cell wall biosynthesis
MLDDELTSKPSGRPRVLYVSYDGAGEPLGRSQVIAYLLRLARDCDITLISFEKDHASRPGTAGLLRAAGIEWVPCTYRRRPPVISTLWDVIIGALTIRRTVRRHHAEIVHVRSYVPALMALLGGRRRRPTKLLFDIRGFWPDERVLAGAWSERSPIYRLIKRLERRFFARADAVVTLTVASVPQIRIWMGGRSTPVHVIPTCAEVERFRASATSAADGIRAVWCGSVGSFYRFDLALRFADALSIPLQVLTPQVSEARALLGSRQADVRTVGPDAVADELRPGDIGLCFYADGFANLARAPTRFAEYLAAGLVVAVTPRIGDLDAIIEQHGVGVIIDDDSEDALRIAAQRAFALSGDPGIRVRARQLAASRYSVESGTRDYLEIYRKLQIGGATSRRAESTLPVPGP